MSSNGQLTIGKLANKAGVNVETIRYYQRIGLINEPAKPHSGYRKYESNMVDTLKFIKRAQQLGFSLAEIGDLLDLGTGNCNDVRSMAEEKKELIQKQINDLRAMHNELEKLIVACEKTESTTKCAIIESLT